MISVDVETTGTDPNKNSILSIGAISIQNPENQFYDECRAWEGATINDQALEINGFTEAEALDPEKKSEAEVVKAFIAWAEETGDNWMLIAQNVSFDRDFIEAACKRAGIEMPFSKRTLDVHTLTWLHMQHHNVPQPSGNHHSLINLAFAARYCGIPEEPKPHNALTGAYCHAEVFSRIAYNKKLLPEFIEYDIPWLT